MNINTFGNLFILLFIILLIVNYTMTNRLYDRYRSTGIVIGLVVSLVINMVVLYSLTKIKIQDTAGNMHSLSDVLISTMSLGIVAVIVAVVFLVMTVLMNYAKNQPRYIPVLTTGVSLIALTIVAKFLE